MTQNSITQLLFLTYNSLSGAKIYMMNSERYIKMSPFIKIIIKLCNQDLDNKSHFIKQKLHVMDVIGIDTRLYFLPELRYMNIYFNSELSEIICRNIIGS